MVERLVRHSAKDSASQPNSNSLQQRIYDTLPSCPQRGRYVVAVEETTQKVMVRALPCANHLVVTLPFHM